jgi:Putative lumazine-binding
MSGSGRASCLGMATVKTQSEHDAILKTLQLYIDGCKQGNGELMRPAFHAQASFFGHAGDPLAVGLDFLFDWIKRNGPAPNIEPRVVSVDIAESIAVVRLEVANWSGNLASSAVRMSDFFTFLRMPEGWIIIQKAFHWYA